MRDLIARPIFYGLGAASPFAAFAGFSAAMAARHAASLFPFGQQICGHPGLAHCAWCLTTPAAGAMAAAAFFYAATHSGRPATVSAKLD